MAWQCSANSYPGLLNNLRHVGILKTDRVYKAMMAVDRRHYVPKHQLPYADAPQSLGYNATISAPHMHAQCLELLKDQLVPGAVALDVGSGSGYLTAAMANMVQPGGHVYGVDHIPELVSQAQETIKETAPDLTSTVTFIVGDGRSGLKQYSPFDCLPDIHVGAAAPDIPNELLSQLKNGGRLIVPIGSVHYGQELMVFDKDQNGAISSSSVTGVRYVPLTSLENQLQLR